MVGQQERNSEKWNGGKKELLDLWKKVQIFVKYCLGFKRGKLNSIFKFLKKYLPRKDEKHTVA